MNHSKPLKDIIVLVADKQMKATIEGLLGERSNSLQIRRLTFDVKAHPEKDSGCCQNSAEFLRPMVRQYAHCLVIFDYEGCGREKKEPPTAIENAVHEQLSRSGWQDRCSVIVVVPELESWVWSSSRKVDEVCGWSARDPDLRTWVAQRFMLSSSGKPTRPKEALEAALQEVSEVLSSSLFRQMAQKVSWKSCQDESFQRLVSVLQNWFPE
ncbi:hypothetical protein GC163_11555 [bacterium]|nr:hypothetical protein [bacterium]